MFPVWSSLKSFVNFCLSEWKSVLATCPKMALLDIGSAVIQVVLGETPRDDECSGEPAFMPIYLVRTIDEHDLVGIFVAPNVLALALLVDECVDPGDCEYSG